MEKRTANHLIVGFFVLCGVVALIGVLFNIGGGKGIFTRKDKVYAKFTHVKGLNYGSEVSLMGFRIGTVSAVEIGKPGDKELVIEMEIDKAMFDRVREDSVAIIRTSGVLGDKYVEVSVGSAESPPLKSGGFIRTEEPDDIITQTGNVVQDISKEFTKGGEVQSLLHHLNEVSTNLAALTRDMRQEKGMMHELVYGSSGAKLNKSVGHLEDILRKIDSGEGTLGALVNDPTVYEDLKTMMGGAKRSTVLKYFMKQFIESGSETEQQSTAKKK